MKKLELRNEYDKNILEYEKWRAPYTGEIFDEIICYSGLNRKMEVLEIGIGTGKATLDFLKIGCKLKAIEIGMNLTNYVRQKFKEFENFEVINTAFEEYPEVESAFDLIYSATAFHWIPQDLGLKKVYFLMKPGGVLSLFWNQSFISQNNRAIRQKVYEAYYKYAPENIPVSMFDGKICERYVNILTEYGFQDARYKICHNSRVLKAMDYISLLNTYSYHKVMEEEIKYRIERDIVKSVNSLGGYLEITDTTELYLAKKPCSTSCKNALSNKYGYGH